MTEEKSRNFFVTLARVLYYFVNKKILSACLIILYCSIWDKILVELINLDSMHCNYNCFAIHIYNY